MTENPGAAGNTVRVERPDPSLPYQQVVRARGQADSVALKLRHHDPAFHARHVPRSAQARQVFNALEQTRCEVRGAQAMAGVAINLDAALDARVASLNLDRLGDTDQAPLPEMLGLLARETMLGQLPPPSASKVLEHWRPKLERIVGTDPRRALPLRARSAGPTRRRCASCCGPSDSRTNRPTPQYDESDDDDAESEGDRERARRRRDRRRRRVALREHGRPPRCRDGAGEEEADASDMESLDPGSLEFDEEDSETPGEAAWRPQPGHNIPDREQYHAYCTDYDEIIEAAGALRAGRAEPAACPPRPAALAPAERHRQAREPTPSVGCWRSRSGPGNSTSKKATSTPAVSRGWSRTPPTRSPTRWRRRRDSVTPWSALLIDNSGSMRGRPIVGRGDERGHPRPHPGALRREGRESSASPPARGRGASPASGGSRKGSARTQVD